VHQAALDQARLEESAARRALAEDMAREVGDRERRRLDGVGYGEPSFGPPSGGWGGGTGERWGDGNSGMGGILGDGTPFALRLLGLLPPAWRVGTGVGAVALVVGLYLFRPAAGLVVGVVLISLFVPGGWRRRRSWW
jgi:hypothetical protein